MSIVADFYPRETSDTFAFFLEGFDAKLAFALNGQLDDCFPRRTMSRKIAVKYEMSAKVSFSAPRLPRPRNKLTESSSLGALVSFSGSRHIDG